MTNWLDLLAPAKINLFLELKAKRDDGFHELETLMSCVDLFDQLSFRVREDSQINLTQASDVTGLPSSDENLIVKALRLLRTKSGFQGGMDVRLEKRIPIQAGLGGASSNAATALHAGNQLWQLGLTPIKLVDLAAELGSDIPFFVAGGSAVCTGRGETIAPLPNINSFPVLITKPPVGLSTPQVFGECSIPTDPVDSRALVAAFQRGDKNEIRAQMLNRLEPAASKVTDWVIRMRQAFDQVDCLAHQLSGSGSCYFGLFGNWKLLHKASAKLLQREPELALYCCRTIGRLAYQSLGRE